MWSPNGNENLPLLLQSEQQWALVYRRHPQLGMIPHRQTSLLAVWLDRTKRGKKHLIMRDLGTMYG